MEGEIRCSGSRLTSQLAFVWGLNEITKKKNFFRETHTDFSLGPIEGEFWPLGQLFCPSRPSLFPGSQ